MLRAILLLAACACLWDIAAAGVLEIRCANVEAGRKVLIPSSAASLQDACQLRVEITPEQSGTYSFMLGLSALTEFIGREDIAGSYMGQPKVFALVNKSEEFADNNLYAIRSLVLDDIPLAGVRSALGARYGTVYLLAALDNGTHFVDSVSMAASFQPPDESGVDLKPVINEMDSWTKDYDGAVVVSSLSPRVPVRISVENLGSTPLAARTDPDALKVWVYVKRMMMAEHTFGSPLVPLTEEVAMHKGHMPAPGDAVISLANVFGQTEPGSPAIPAGSSIPLTLTELAISDMVCGDAVVFINVDPIGEMTDTNMTNNVVGIRVRSRCDSTGGRCFLYGMPTPGRTLVALHHDYMNQPSNMIEYRAVSGAIRPLHPFEMTATERVSLMHSVVLTHAVQAEVDRLQAIGSCDSADDAEPPTWGSSILGRLADSMANIRAPLLAVSTTGMNESEQLDMAALVVETVGQLLQQPGSLRTILSTIIHGEGDMRSPGMEGNRPGRGGGGYDGENGYPGYGGDGNFYGSGHYSGGSGYYSGGSGYYSGGSGYYSGSSGGYSDYSGSSGDYSDYSGSSGDYSDYSGSSGDYSDYSSGSGGLW
ncbi:uncharacterized protein LOC119089517 [Pollicipes pollicipes]|uniref:uncharacterized protein LOC119089517 n=1 Tax=Pollicipes pollicipes TaxID=41117 RepID=UPI0018855DFC|nr:uncharacterized protein LOC119089517 [Pollicipes pollicipes]